MIEPEPTPTGCGWTVLLNFVAGFLLYFTGISPIDSPTAALDLRIELAPTETTELAPIIEVLEQRLMALGIEGAAVSAQDERIVVEIRAASLPVDEITLALTQRGQLEFTDFDEQANQPLQTILTVDGIRDADVIVDPGGQWAVEMTLTEEGGEIMERFTESHIGEKLGIVLDGDLLITPTIYTTTRDKALISGRFTQAEAQRIAALIEGGTLPVDLTVLAIE